MTHRDEVRAARHEINKVGVEHGIDMASERAKTGANERTLVFETTKLINTQTPRVDREQQQLDDPPPTGAFDGVNQTFTLSAPVKGLNIHVIWHDSANNTSWPLVRTDSNTPGNHEFFFDRSTPTIIIVGNPPLVEDRLMAVYSVQGR